MELQNSASMPGPLSPGYTAPVPYNYNQLEGRFKQLQGKPCGVSLSFIFFKKGALLRYEAHKQDEVILMFL